MMQRRSLGTLVALALLGANALAQGQAGGRKRRVGVMTTPSQAASTAHVSAFKQGMADLGWQEGRNLEYQMAYADGDFGRFEALARKLVAWNAEVIVAGPPQAVLAAQAAAPGLPIVMAFVGDPITSGFALSLARPGGYITGMSAQTEDMRGKPVELLHELAPGARRIAVLLSAQSGSTDRAWTGAEQACAALGLQAQRFTAKQPSEIAGAVEQIVRQKMDAVVVPTDGMYVAQRVPLQALLQAARLPAVFTFREHVLAGGLLSYGPSTSANFRASAKFVDKILKGAKPADLPIEQPTVFELVINLGAAKALGINVPKALLLRADEVMQ